MEIRIKIENNVATLLSKEPLVCGNSDYKVVFEFDEEWNEYPAKTAMFVFNKQSVQQPFDGSICNGVSIENATVCAIGVFVGDKKASTGVTIDCMLSIKDDGTTPAPPSKDVYDELIELLNEYIKAAQGALQGGKKGQVLKKLSDEDYDVGWEDDERSDLSHYDRYDYVISNSEDFATDKLATMSGRVLVKEVEIDVSSATPLKVVLPKSITEIKFVNSKIYADIEASENSNTAIVGFVGNYYENVAIGFYPILRGFNRVEYCEGFPKLYNCNNIERSVIHSADNCHSISNVYCFANFQGEDYTAFYRCSVISNITFRDEMGGSSSERIVDFYECNHLSNIHALDPSVIINYNDCKNVVGETCDGYFTEAEQGKVQTVTTDGTSAFVSVYSQDEIDGKLGDISSILTALHEGGIE